MVKKGIKRGYRVTKYIIYKETFIDKKEHFWSFLGAFLGISIIAMVHSGQFVRSDYLFLIGSFGASSVLVYGAIHSPLAQPRNLIGGHLISALLGVTIFKLMPDVIWVTAPLAVSLSIVLMQATKTLHPPGGATALAAVIGSEKITDLGYIYVLSPVLSGAAILLFVAMIFNNITVHRKYPSDGRFLRTIKWAAKPTRRMLSGRGAYSKTHKAS